MDISLKELEAAFAKVPVEVRTTLDVFTRSGSPVHSFRYPVTNAEATARRFFDHLRVHRERDPSPWAEDNDVVDAHICCEHADGPGPNVIGADHVCEHPVGDREVQLMVDILRGMAGLDPDARQRIRNWVDERFARAHPF